MTRRERMERKLERREEWAGKAKGRAAQRFGTAGGIADGIPMGQPILVGHHSEGRARRDQDRIHGNMRKGCEEASKAEHHASKARGIAAQLDRSIFSDDHDAVEQLQKRIAEREEEARRYTVINKAWRKTSGSTAERVAQLVERGICGEKLAKSIARTMELCPWMDKPLDTTNIRASIRRDKNRLAGLQERAAKESK